MANLSEDIQCAGFDTRPPMLDRTDFPSWKQHIRLYFQGKKNKVNILKSIDEVPFQMGSVQEPLAEGTEGAPHLGPERPRVYSDLSPEEKDQYNANIRATNILLQGLPKDIYTLINHYTDAKDIWDNVKMLLEGFELTKEDQESQMYDDFEHFQQYKRETVHDYYVWFAKLINDMRNNKMTMSRMQLNSKGQGMNPRGGGASGYGGVQNRVGNASPGQARQVKCYNCNDAEQLLFLAGGQDDAIDDDVDEQPVQDLALNVDNVFQADDCDVFDSDVDEAPTAQTMFMANLSSADLVTDEAGPSYDSNILSEVQKHDHYQDAVCAYHEEHAMHDNVQVNHVVDSHADYTSDSNTILYDQYVKDNAVPVVHIVETLLTAKTATYKEQVKLYERRAKFELTEREQKINEQLRLVISDRNFKEETLKKELHFIKLQLASTINHKKSMVEEVTFLKKDFKQKENKYLEYFLDMKSLKEKVAIGYKNPLCLTHAKQVHPALYNDHEIIKDNHVPDVVHNTEDTLEIAEITRRKMNDKMKDPECVTHKVKIAPHDYSKENFLATFTPQKQLTPSKYFELKAEVAQNVVDRKHDATERKNLLIANDNLIAECLSKEVFSIATNSELNVARFTEMHVANTIIEARCLELEAELSNLRDKSHNDNPDELVNRFSNLEVDHLILQLKYQNLKYSFDNNPPTPDKDTPDFDSVFVIGKMQASLQGKDNVIRQLKKQTSHLQETRSDTDRTLKHYKELCNSIMITRAKHIEQVTALTTKNVNLKAQILDKVNSVSKDHVKPKVLAPGKYAIDVEPIVPRLRNSREAYLDYLRHLKESVETIHDIVEEAKVMTNVPVPPSTGVKRCTNASGSQPKSNIKKNRISPAKGVNKLPVEEQPRTNKSHLRTSNRVNSSSRFKRIRILCGGLGHNLFSVGQFCDSNLEVAFKKHLCYVRDTDGVELIKGSCWSNLYTISVEDIMKSSLICLLSKASKNKSWLWH
nr:Gag-Pol polyprotein [Tanacetum cinerariifolium]